MDGYVQRNQRRQLVQLGELPLGSHSTLVHSHFQATIFTVLLIGGSFLNALTLFTRIKLYNLYNRPDLVNSPRAVFVTAELDHIPLEPPPLRQRFMKWFKQTLRTLWSFFWNMKSSQRGDNGSRFERIQQLSVWDPGMFESTLLTIYSPAHAFLWSATNTSNWIMMFSIMGLVGIQVRACFSVMAVNIQPW